MRRRVAITYGDALFATSKIRCGRELESLGLFDSVHIYGPEDLGEEFLAAHGEFLATNPRGGGYWLWKSYLIWRELCRLEDGDILVYGDAGNSVVGTPAEFQEILTEIETGEAPLLGEQNNWVGSYCKVDLMIFMNITPEYGRRGPMIEANRLFFRNCPEMRELAKRWYDICSHHWTIDDTPSQAPNFPEYVEHRHDQAVFSLLFSEYNGEICEIAPVWIPKRIRG